MATLELEADFVKGLRFMLSTSRDAPESLRAILDEAIRSKFGSSKSLGTFCAVSTKIKVEDDYATLQISERNSDESSSSKDEDDDDDDDEGALSLDMMEEDLTCVICRGLSVGPRNRLVECLECSNLYHQECHRPPIPDHDVGDPRNAWYCSTCTRNMHRSSTTSATESSKQQSSKSSSKSYKSGSSRDSPTTVKQSSSSRAESSSSSQSAALFKRADKGSAGSSGSSGSKSSPVGMAALAASLQPSSKSSSSSTSSKPSSSSSSKGTSSSTSSSSSSKNFGASSQPKPTSSSPTLISADKRLQIMKKKAAKMQEKRKHSK